MSARWKLTGSILVFTFALMLSSCAPEIISNKNTAPPVPGLWPLTSIPTDHLINRPAISVKIENDPMARPQSGMQDADIVWETLIEGGVTRFIAVYNSILPEAVGPVRSLRIADGPITGPMKGVLVFTGSNGYRFQEVAQASGTQVLYEDGGADGFFRDGYNAPHNDYFTLQAALDQADKEHKAAPAAQFSYAPIGVLSTAEELGIPAQHLTAPMSTSYITKWDYDETTQLYSRSQEDEPFMDKLTGQQIAAVNIIVLEMEISGTPEIDPAGTPEMQMHAVGAGRGLVMVGGKILDIKWSKKNEKSNFKLTTLEKEKVLITPGNTWVVLVPTDEYEGISYN